MIERRQAGRQREISQSASDRSTALCDLIGIRQMKLTTMCNPGRTQGYFPAPYQGLAYRDRKEEIRFADVIVVKEIDCPGAEVVGINNPSPERYRDTELVFFIEFSMERNESQIVSLRKLQQRAGSSDERRCLIVVTKEGSKCPVQMRNIQCSTDTGANRALHHTAAEMGGAHSSHQGQPRRDFESV